PGEHGLHVGLRVVVGVDRLLELVGCTGGGEVVGGGDDRVGLVPAVGGAVVVRVDAVLGPRFGEELHRPAGASLIDEAFCPAGGVGCAAVLAFDLADRGEQLPGYVEGEPGLLVEEQVVGGDVGERRLRGGGAVDAAGGGAEGEC